jgi:hypothetical protein
MGFIIFSVDRSELRPDQNKVSRIWLLEQFCVHDIKYKTVEGCYQGSTETSYLVSDTHEAFVKSVCDITKQDCYLRVDNNKNSEIVNKYGDSVSIGLFQNVNKATAESLRAYTKDGDEYYVASKDLFPRPSFK